MPLMPEHEYAAEPELRYPGLTDWETLAKIQAVQQQWNEKDAELVREYEPDSSLLYSDDPQDRTRYQEQLRRLSRRLTSNRMARDSEIDRLRGHGE